MIIFGDSIPYGLGASKPSSSWAGRLTPVNVSVPAAQAADLSRIAQAWSADPKETYKVEIGTNDVAKYKGDADKQEYFRRTLRGALAWLLLIDKKTARGAQAGITFSGIWADSPSPNPCGKYTTKFDASASATVTGTAVYIGLSEGDYVDMGESINVVIDGVDKGTYPVKIAGVKTYLGQWWGRVAWYFGGLSAGPHAVTVKSLSPNGKFLHVDYIAGSTQTTQAKTRLFNILKFSDAGYTASGTTQAMTDAFNTILSELVAEFAGHGHDIELVDGHASIDSALHLSDGTHPNDDGHFILARLMEAAG